VRHPMSSPLQSHSIYIYILRSEHSRATTHPFPSATPPIESTALGVGMGAALHHHRSLFLCIRPMEFWSTLSTLR
jgi:hypothetical protein